MALASDPHAQEAYDRLATLVALVRADGTCLMVNMALENTVRLPRSRLVHSQAAHWFNEPALLRDALRRVLEDGVVVSRFAASLHCVPPGPQTLAVHVAVSPLACDASEACALVEMTELEQQSRLDRAQRARELASAHKELLRNLAHEVKNPLGGIRGAAQLLALEHPGGSTGEYAGVIVREVDRLQALVDRLLAPHQAAPAWAMVNIHEVCEHVRTLVLAEFPNGLDIQRDYDASLPELRADRERLIQALLNIVRNAAQALTERVGQGDARIVLRTRIAHQATLAGRRHRLALELEVEDNGPGVPPALRERIFQPLVTGRPEGTGLGLTLAQTLVQQQGGSIACDSSPAATRFTLVLPLPLPEKS